MKYIFFLLASYMLCGHVMGQNNWRINSAKSHVTFSINGPLAVTVEGKFSSPTGTLIFDPTNLEQSSFKVSIEANTIFTDNRKRDEHLKKAEFFDIAKYKTITFTSNNIEKTTTGYVAIGNLKMKDEIKPVKIPFTFLTAANVGTWKGELKLNRLDYGVGESSIMMGDEVKIYIEIIGVSSL